MKFICADKISAEIEASAMTDTVGGVEDLEEFPVTFTALQVYKVEPANLPNPAVYRIKDDGASNDLQNWAYITERTLSRCFVKV